MTTRAIMLAEIQSDMERTSATEATAITSKINAAIRHYQPMRFWFNESRSITLSTVVGTDTYTFNTATTTGTIGAEFYRLDGVWFSATSTDVRELERVNYDQMEAWADSQSATNGEPMAYAYVNRGLRFYRNPDAIYTLRLAGHLKLAAPATDAEADNPWMTEAYDLIMSRAKAELYVHRWPEPENAMLMRAAERDALSALTAATYDKVSSDHLEATEF